ncbi:MAG: hypothetical protein JRH17_19210, partial [Deltaproteobacteria bacterium]|nr:hypothetical protein [Deltaproteobacteria bacterium]
CMGLAFLLIAEVALRLAGFGGRPPLFVDAPGAPGYRHTNPEVMQRYYSGTVDVAATIEPILFRADRPTAGHRFVVQGGSTAAGFPYGRWGGLAGMLGDRLEAIFPDLEIEVITTAMAAVNSYTLLDLVDEIIEIEPDAVLIYAGHNEYLGVLGVGSALGGGRSRTATLAYIKLRQLGLYRIIESCVGLARGSFGSAGESDPQSLFARAAGGSLIPFGSDAYHRGRIQFEANLGEVLRRYRDAGIPVYVGTLVSNEKDQAPFAGDSARDWYVRAQQERASGHIEPARTAFQNARDHDELRFRAPTSFNAGLREMVERFGATLVDVDAAFRAAAPDGTLGQELLLEHVHPNAEGYFLLASTYLAGLKRDGWIGDWSHAPSEAEARRDMPITVIDRILAEYAVAELKAGFPFRELAGPYALPTPQSEMDTLAQLLQRGELDWLHAMDRLLQIYRRADRFEDAALVARLGAQAYPTEHGPNHAAGMLYMELNQPARARRYLERASRAKSDDQTALEALIRADRQIGALADAREHIGELRRRAPNHPMVRRQARDRAAAPGS